MKSKHINPRRVKLHALALLSAVALPAASLAAPTAIVAGDSGLCRPKSTLSGATDKNTSITIALVLPLQDPAGAKVFAERVSQPGDKLFRHSLSPAQFAARFGARPADYAALVAWAKAAGLTVGEEYSAHSILSISGSASALGAALGVRFNDYKDASGASYYVGAQPARLPVAVAGMVRGVLGLSGANHFAQLVHIKPSSLAPQSTGTGVDGAFSAADLRTAYAIPAQSGPAGTQVVGLFEQGGFFASDVAAYVTANKLPTIPVIARGVDGYGTTVDDPGIELEAVLDIDMVMAMNPVAKKIVVYEDGAFAFQVALLNGLSAMASDGTARSIGISYGIDEALQSPTGLAAENEVLTQLAAQGQAVFVSAGDAGAYGDEGVGLHVEDPASQPFVTAVGGTSLFTTNKQVRLFEKAWNDLDIPPFYYAATGGGISTIWPAPGYQLLYGTTVVTANGGSATMRNVPDVASVGDPFTGVEVYSSTSGGWVTVGGTSVGAPLWAGTYSLVVAASEALGFGPAGFANPALYGLSQGQTLFGHDYLDVQTGTNGDPSDAGGLYGFHAGPGYDNVSGNGTPNGITIIANLALAPTYKNTNPPAAVTKIKTVVTSTSIKLAWVAAKDATGYAVDAANAYTGALLNQAVTHTPTITYTGLQPGVIYGFQVFSASTGGFSYSPPVYVSTLK